MASTAAASPPFLSPRPTQRAAAMAAASVTRTSSMAKLRSGASPRAACGCPSSTSYVASVVGSPILGWDVTRTPRVVTAGPHRGKGHGRLGMPGGVRILSSGSIEEEACLLYTSDAADE